jgi:hypothetical protein
MFFSRIKTMKTSKFNMEASQINASTRETRERWPLLTVERGEWELKEDK